MQMDKTGAAKSDIGKIKEGIGKGPGMGSGGAVDPTSQNPANRPSAPWDWNSDANLKPNKPGGNTKSF